MLFLVFKCLRQQGPTHMKSLPLESRGLLARSHGWLLLALLVCASISRGADPAQASLPGDRLTYGNGPAHSGYFPGTLNGLPFVFRWKAPMPNYAVSQPAIADYPEFAAALAEALGFGWWRAFTVACSYGGLGGIIIIVALWGK
jgi:hypothetical protein